MAQVYTRLTLDVKKKNHDIVTAVQQDTNARFLDIVLLDNGIPIHLEENEVRIYAKKPDGTEVFNDGEITNAQTGRCQFEMTTQLLAAVGVVEAQVVIFKDNVQILTTLPFTIHVVKNLMTDTAVESSNEYGALVVLFQNLYEAYDLMTEMVQKIGVPGPVAEGLSLDTMFEVWDWMCQYLQDNSSAGVTEKIGNPEDYNKNTLFGILNQIPTFGTEIYILPGQYTFTVPERVRAIFITGAGGGGGGAAGSPFYGSNQTHYSGGGGGGAAAVFRHRVYVTPGENINITVGMGGSGGTSNNGNNGGSGSSTIIGDYLTIPGGGGGIFGGSGGSSGGSGGGSGGDGKSIKAHPIVGGGGGGSYGGGGGYGIYGATVGENGQPGIISLGGTQGEGGVGGYIIMSNGQKTNSYNGASGSGGGGGGGAAATSSGGTFAAGGSGGGGIVIIEW